MLAVMEQASRCCCFFSSSSSLLLWPPSCAITSRRSQHLIPASSSSSSSSSSSTKASSGFLPIRCSFIWASRTPPRLRSCSRRAAGGNPPPPLEEGDQNYISGIQSTLSGIQDRLRIFFSVLFWMSLFFWGSACDRSDDPKKKGPWFRK